MWICEIAQPCKLFSSQYLRYDDSLFFIITFHVFVTLMIDGYWCFCILMNNVTFLLWYLFLPLIAYWYQLKNLILICFYSCLPAAILLQYENWHGQGHTFQNIVWKFSNTSANNHVSPWTCKSWYSPKLFILKFL